MSVTGAGAHEASGRVRLGTQWVATEDVAVTFTGWIQIRPEETRIPVEFLDWTIDGLPLRSMLTFSSGQFLDERTRMVKGWEGEPWAASSLRALLDGYVDSGPGRVNYDSGRTAILFCSQCSDLSCPAITTRIEHDESTVRWSDIGYETDWSETPEFETFDRITLTFEKEEYEATIRALLAQWHQTGQ